MSYGELKIDTITFTAGGVDTSVSVSGLVQNPTFTGNITTTGTISGDVIKGNTISGVNVIGTTEVSGATVTGNVGLFGTITGGIHTLTSGVFASGTAANPSITFVDDLNTGIYSPGADQVAISTSGTGRLFVDSSGNVGVGGTPNAQLNLIAGVPTLRWTDSDTSGYSQILQSDTSLYIDADRGAAGTGALIFRTNGTNERMRITSDGKVGVGTSSPTGLLTVAADFPVIDWAYASNTAFKHTIGATGYATSPVSGNHLAIKVASGSGTQATVMHLNGAGQVGIGTTSPGSALEVNATAPVITINSAAANASSIEFKQAGTLYGRVRFDGNDFDIGNLYTGGATIINAGNAERARITSDGKLGLGTSNPSDLLHIKSTAAQFKIESSSGVNNCILHRNGATDAWRVGMNLALSNGSYEIYDDVNNVDRLVIDSSGNVGIGTTSPAAFTPSLQIDGTDPGFFMRDSGTSEFFAINVQSGAVLSWVEATADFAIGRASGLTGASYTESLRITSGGNVGIGTSTVNYNLHVSSSVATAYTSTSRNSLLGVYNANTTSGVYSGIELSAEGAGNASVANISAIDVGSGSTDLAIGLRNSNTFEEKIRIKSGGNVGIGTTSPISELHVEKATQAHISVKTTSSNMAKFGSKGDDVYIAGTANATNVIFKRAVVSVDHPADSGIETARIDSSGRLLVGTSSSDAQRTSKVQIAGNGDLSGWGSSLNLSEFGTTYNPWIALQRSRNSTIGSHTVVNSGDILGGIQFNGSDGNSFESGASIKCEVDGTPGDADMPGRLVFSTTADGASSPTERMRIDSTGSATFTGVGTYVASFSNQTNTSGYNGILSVVQSNGNDTSTFHFRGNTNSVGNWYLYGNGTTSYSSDERLKKNIETTRDGYLSDIQQLRVVKYNWRNHDDNTPKELGLIAQEVEQVFPGLVQDDIEQVSPEDTTHYKQLKGSVLPVILLKALQEAAERIETLEAKVAALEAQ